MLGGPKRPLIYHGEQIGVTTLSLARLQRSMLETRPVLAADTETLASFIGRYGETLGHSCWEDFARKRLDDLAVEKLNDRLASSWSTIAERIEAVSLKADYLERVLKAAGAPVTPEEIYLPRPFYEQALLRSREIRNRYSFLDLAANSGKLEPALTVL
jgi:glycerol-1-phosphate dehydrogenase [NAD(P)+]